MSEKRGREAGGGGSGTRANGRQKKHKVGELVKSSRQTDVRGGGGGGYIWKDTQRRPYSDARGGGGTYCGHRGCRRGIYVSTVQLASKISSGGEGGGGGVRNIEI